MTLQKSGLGGWDRNHTTFKSKHRTKDFSNNREICFILLYSFFRFCIPYFYPPQQGFYQRDEPLQLYNSEKNKLVQTPLTRKKRYTDDPGRPTHAPKDIIRIQQHRRKFRKKILSNLRSVHQHETTPSRHVNYLHHEKRSTLFVMPVIIFSIKVTPSSQLIDFNAID